MDYLLAGERTARAAGGMKRPCGFMLAARLSEINRNLTVPQQIPTGRQHRLFSEKRDEH
jgi:hypothetical protein